MKHEKLIEKHLGVNTPYWIKEKVDNAINEALRQFSFSDSLCVSRSLSLETIADYVTKEELSIHLKICNLWLKSGNKIEDFPKLPPCWFDVKITLKNGKKYKSFLASINNWGGVQFIINQRLKKRIYLDTDEVVSWEFV